MERERVGYPVLCCLRWVKIAHCIVGQKIEPFHFFSPKPVWEKRNLVSKNVVAVSQTLAEMESGGKCHSSNSIPFYLQLRHTSRTANSFLVYHSTY